MCHNAVLVSTCSTRQYYVLLVLGDLSHQLGHKKTSEVRYCVTSKYVDHIMFELCVLCQNVYCVMLKCKVEIFKSHVILCDSLLFFHVFFLCS